MLTLRMLADEAPVDVPLVLSGYGPVGQAFVAHLGEHAPAVAARYGVALRVAAVRASTGQCDLSPTAGVPPRISWGPLESIEEVLARTGTSVFLQAIPSSPALAEHAAREAITALRLGVHVVTATKIHLLSHWGTLAAAARAGNALVRISGATGAALPAGDLARVSLRGLDCESIRGCPNGVVTFVLDRLAAGAPLREAVAEAQRRGIAEADPSADLSGADTATKLRLLAATLWGWDPAGIEVNAEAIDAGSAAAAVAATGRGHRLRMVGEARLDEPHIVRVVLAETAPGDPLFGLVGPEKAMTFACREAGAIVVSGGRSSPIGAALAMLKDTLDVIVPRVGFG
jgi:homoserine dehydrogenase